MKLERYVVIVFELAVDVFGMFTQWIFLVHSCHKLCECFVVKNDGRCFLWFVWWMSGLVVFLLWVILP